MSDVATKPQAVNSWAPFARKPFAVLWIATVISNVGTWMNDVGAGWLMTELSPSPLVVAAVQAATTLPIFLFAMLAGAMADIFDRRRMLIVINSINLVIVSALAVAVSAGTMTPTLLLVFTFLIGTGAAFLAPAWQAIVPKLVPREELGSAIALNSMGINVSRAIGPALAGFLIVTVGLWSPFAINAASFVVILIALVWWKPEVEKVGTLPHEHVRMAMITGLRYARNSKPLRATLVRSGAFFLFASAFWAMLPLIARNVLGGGPTLYGTLLASLGAGAVAGAIVLPTISKKLGPDRTVALGTLGTAIVLIVLAVVPNNIAAACAAALAGLSWIAVLSSLNVSAQMAVPNWVRARGLSLSLTIFFGSMSAGSLIWGQIAGMASIPTALIAAAVGALLLIPLTWRAKLGQGAEMDLSPSSHWPQPLVEAPNAEERGPVMIQVRYEIDPERQLAFTKAMSDLAYARRRSGAYRWTLMQDAQSPHRFVESWFEASWIDHLRHHERVSVEDKRIQDKALSFDIRNSPPAAEHYFDPGRDGETL